MPKTEVCNGIDNDCDGIVDNGNFPQAGRTASAPTSTQAQVGVGVCKAGKLVCRGTPGSSATAASAPAPEICDGKDNDCDGKADTHAKCPTSFGCREGACTLVARAGEFPCPRGYKCIDTTTASRSAAPT